MSLEALRPVAQGGGGKRALAAALAGLERDPDNAGAQRLLDAAWRAPRAHVVGVTGPPGVGKSSLCAALVSGWLKDGKPVPGALPVLEYLPNSTDWYGRWRPAASAANDYRIDREAQRNDLIYTGISHIHMQDQAITESMGDIVDHSFEHLAPSDQMITRTRRRLLLAARALRERNEAPPGARTPSIYADIRSGEFLAKGGDWQSVYEQALRQVVRPLAARRAAE